MVTLHLVLVDAVDESVSEYLVMAIKMRQILTKFTTEAHFSKIITIVQGAL